MIESTSETETTIVTIILERKYNGPNCFVWGPQFDLLI